MVFGDLLAGHRRAERRVGRGDALGRRDDVRHNAVVGRCEQLAETSESADDLIHDHQDAGFVAEFANLLEVVLRTGRDAAAGVLDRFHDDARDRFRSLELDQPLDLVVAGQIAGCIVLAIRAAVPVRHRRVAGAGHERTKAIAGIRQAVDRKCAKGRAVPGSAARDRLVPVREALDRLVLLRDLECRFDRFAATGGEEDTGVAAERNQVGQPICEDCRRYAGEAEWVDEGNLLELGHHRLGDLAPAVSGVDRVDTGQAIEVGIAVGIPDGAAFALDEDERLVGRLTYRLHVRVVEPDIVLDGVPDLLDIVAGRQESVTFRHVKGLSRERDKWNDVTFRLSPAETPPWISSSRGAGVASRYARFGPVRRIEDVESAYRRRSEPVDRGFWTGSIR